MKPFLHIAHSLYWLVVILLVGGAAYFAFDTYKTLNAPMEFFQQGSKAPPPASKKEEKPEPPKPLAHYETVWKRNLFRDPEAETKNPSKGPGEGDRPLPELRLQLKGTVLGTGESTFAIIEDLNDRKEGLYHIHDTIQEAKIVNILKDRVILSRGGVEETLVLFQERKAVPPAVRPGSAPPARPTLPSAAPIEQAPKVLSREEVPQGNLDVQRLMSQLRITPHFVAGRPEGFQVGDIQKGSLAEKAGIRNGDIIKGINGIRTDSPSQLLRAYRQLRETAQLQIEVEREGQRQNISLKVE